ncbi:MAG TPA: bifunctional riboflavin kinase/FAD synthetase [Candidatus Angelobacter sp.]|jgi:riboflavin kinase/FMN adenylyltransferase|nr:bifunctional riboflavin kinase/FAD synthetase [Candidatus Angelobacter sp.]
MEVLRDPSSLPESVPGTAVTVGFFDGVHLGHRAVVERTRAEAAELGVPSAVLLLDRHPATVVRPDSAPRLLTDLGQRLSRLGALGVDYAVLLDFDGVRSLQAPEEFVASVLAGELRARAVVTGEDFHFGLRRRGDPSLLAALGGATGFRSVQVPPLRIGGDVVSSTLVRGVVAAGDMHRAAALLGRPFELHGVVEHGDGRGRTIGCPTANVALPGDMLLPSDGVYAGWYRRADGARIAAAISVGRRPTFYDENGMLLVEAHLLDFEGDLYGEQAWIEVTDWLRGQERFASVEDLTAALQRDVAHTRELTARDTAV